MSNVPHVHLEEIPVLSAVIRRLEWNAVVTIVPTRPDKSPSPDAGPDNGASSRTTSSRRARRGGRGGAVVERAVRSDLPVVRRLPSPRPADGERNLPSRNF